MESRCIKDIILSKNEVRFEISLPNNNSKLKSDIFQALSEINLDIITQNPPIDNNVKLFINTSDDNFEKISAIFEKLNVDYSSQRGLEKISILGVGIKTNLSVLYGILTNLKQNGVKIITVSTSEIKISLLISNNSGEIAYSLLNKTLS